MKKLIATVLALLLALACVPAMAAQGDAVLGRNEEGSSEEYFNRCFTDGETLYLASYNGLHTYRVGDAETERYEWKLAQPEGEENYNIQPYPFICDGKLYAILLHTRYGENTEFIKAELAELTLTDGHEVEAAPLRELDWSGMVEYYDQDAYPRTPETCLGVGGKLLMSSYDNDYVLYTLDLETGRIEQSDVKDAYAVLQYRDGKALIEQFSYNQSSVVRFAVYDPKDDSLAPLGEVQIEDYNPYSGLAYDAGTDTLYCLQGGEIRPLDMATGELGEAAADMPLPSYGGQQGACILDGGYYVYCSEGVVVRNLDPSQRAEVRLKIYDGVYADGLDKANYRFSNAHGDISLAISRDYAEGERVVENMMNRDDSVDIYILDADEAVYNAVYTRGYMMELDGSEKLAAMAARVYPSLAEALSYNGRLVAVPVRAYSWAMSVNERALQKLGLTRADVPTNWSDFLDFLADDLPQRMSAESGVSLFYEGASFESAKNDLFYRVFDDYQKHINATDPSVGFDTPLLQSLLEKLERIDFTALGCPHETPEEEEDAATGGGRVVEYSGDEREVLQLFETGVGCTFGNFYGENLPILMAMDAQSPAYLALDMGVAFINPFTRHPAEATAFLEELVDCLPQTVLYTIDPSLDEPVRSSYYETNLQEINKMLEKARSDYETAEAADKQALEEEIRQLEESLDWVEKYGWDVSRAQLDWYRANDDNLILASVNWLYSDQEGEASQLISQYLAGQIDRGQMLAGIDKKVQMMMLEGN